MPSSTNVSILVASAPCNVYVGGQSFAVVAGDRLRLTLEEANEILSGPYGSRFVHICSDQTGDAMPLAEQAMAGVTTAVRLEPTVEQQLYRTPIAANESPLIAPGTTDPLQLLREGEREATELMDSVIEVLTSDPDVQEPAEPVVKDELDSEQATVDINTDAEGTPKKPKASVSVTPRSVLPPLARSVKSDAQLEESLDVKIPLDEDAHYSVVKKYLLDRVAAKDPSLTLIAKTLKARYPTYTSVVEECNKILVTQSDGSN